MVLLSKFTVPLGWRAILQRTCGQIYRGQCFGWAAALAYYSFLALFPALLFVVSLTSVLPIQHLTDQVMDVVARFAPGDVVAIAREQLHQITRTSHGSLLTLRPPRHDLEHVVGDGGAHRHAEPGPPYL
jgi:membrane protein